MTALEQLQTDFQNFLLTLGDSMDEHVVGTTKFGTQERLAVYADAYRLRLLEALEDNYPALHTLLGDEEFDRLGRRYIDAHPSSHPSIRWFGHKMHELLREETPYRSQPVLSEMALFEWTLRGAFDAADESVCAIDDITGVTPQAWPKMRLQFHPSVTRLNLVWNVPALWKKIDQDKAPDKPKAEEYPASWVIWRQELQQFYRSVATDEGWALDAMIDGQNFGDICGGLCEWIDEQNVAVRAAGFLKQWINDGMVTSINV
ncbi:MAG: DUF2063 domain-containing protein [Gammaproteobacteria bacterium]|nr:DUF2063 domain-containing protein [Gammaproteobacteria bacterium]